MRPVLPFFLFIFPLFLNAQTVGETDEDYANDNVLRYDDYIYKQNIRTVQFHESTWDYSAPIIPLRSSEILELSFDDLDGDKKQYMITFVHCNADWTPSN